MLGGIIPDNIQPTKLDHSVLRLRDMVLLRPIGTLEPPINLGGRWEGGPCGIKMHIQAINIFLGIFHIFYRFVNYDI